jgi:hypothetical protein
MGNNSVKNDRDGVEGVGCVIPPLKMVSTIELAHGKRNSRLIEAEND